MYLVTCWRSRRQGDVEKGFNCFAFIYHPCIPRHIQGISLGYAIREYICMLYKVQIESRLLFPFLACPRLAPKWRGAKLRRDNFQLVEPLLSPPTLSRSALSYTPLLFDCAGCDFLKAIDRFPSLLSVLLVGNTPGLVVNLPRLRSHLPYGVQLLLR